MENSSQTNPQVFRNNRLGRNLELVSTSLSEPSRAQALEAKEADLKAALAIVKTAQIALGPVAIRMVALLATVCAFVWAMASPSELRLAGACLCALLVFLPTLWRG